MGETDLISRQSAIGYLMTNMIWYDEYGYESDDDDYKRECITELINGVPSAQQEPSQVARDIATIIENEQDMRVIERNAQQWIPCSERLPEKKRKTYWVCTDTEYQCECRWTNNRFGLGESDNWGWSYFDTPQYTEIIAWMPLPEPYKGEQE